MKGFPRRGLSSVTRSELLRARVCPTTLGLSGKERELDLVVTRAVARRGVPYPATPPPVTPPASWLRLKPLPRREPAAAAAAAMFRFEQNDIFDLRRELWRSNVFCAENGDGRTK